jgi:hypothetical protein
MKKYDASEIGKGLAALVMLGLFIAGFYGYVANIITLFHSTGDITGQFILRIIGIFVAPLGSILGFM